MAKKKLTFEESLNKLEEIVEKLEAGDIPLEEAIEYYKAGMELSKSCHTTLQNIEKEMVQILGEDGELTPFAVEGGEN